jgi:phage-related protein
MLRFQAEFYEEKGRYPVSDFLESLPMKAKAKAAQFISLLEEKGTGMPYKYCKKLTHSELWELKVNYRTNTYRIFFFYHGRDIILLHGISKKTDETPKGDLELSEKRMREWLKREGIEK